MLKKVVLPALIISGSFLAAFGTILALQGNKLLEVRSDNEQLFNGKVRDVFTPTMGVLLSAGVGLAAWTAIGCGYSLKKSNDLESEVTKLQKLIAEREKQIQALKVDSGSPMMSQLKWFIDEEANQSQSESFSNPTSHPTTVKSVDSIEYPQGSTTTTVPTPVEPQGNTPRFEYQVIRDSQPAVRSAAMAFPVAQAGLGLTHKHTNSQASNNQK